VTPRQQTLIRESWAQVAPIADTAATIFYDRLFELDPSLRKLFSRTDMAGQRRDLMQTLALRVTASRPPTSRLGLAEEFTAELREAWAAAYGILAGVMQSAAAEIAA